MCGVFGDQRDPFNFSSYKRLRVGIGVFGDTIDMQKNQFSFLASLTDCVFESLLCWSSDFELMPQLLTKIPKFDEDGVTLPCELVSGVFFHNGTVLTPEDVKFTFERMFFPATEALNYGPFLSIKGAREMLAGERNNLDEGIIIHDDLRFSFVLSGPSSTFVSALGTPAAYIYPREACVLAGGRWGGGVSVAGTGKYLLMRNDNATTAELRRFKGYHGDLAELDEIKVLFYLNSDDKMQAFMDGDIDWCDLSFGIFDDYKTNPAVQDCLHSYLPIGLQFVNLNFTNPQLAQVEVRRALSLAIDRDSLVEKAMGGQGEAASGFLTPQLPGFDQDRPVLDYDPQLARELLEKAAPEGLSIGLCYRSIFSKVAAAVRDFWCEVGVDCELRPMDEDIFMKESAEGDIEAFIGGWFAEYPEPYEILSYFITRNSRLHSSFYSNHEFDQLVEQASAEPAADKRVELYRRADELLTDQDCAAIPLLYPHYNYVAKPYVLDSKVINMALDLKDADVDTAHEDYDPMR